MSLMDARHPLGRNLGPQFLVDPQEDYHWHNMQRPSMVLSGVKPELGIQEANQDDLLGLAMHTDASGLQGRRPKLSLN